METKKNILIITDDNQTIQKMAKSIVDGLGDAGLLLVNAKDFSPTALMAADMVFLGCGEPNPASFAYLEEVLRHISLVGRPCGIFSSGSQKVLDYLRKITKDSELAVSPGPSDSDNSAAIKSWITDLRQRG